MPDQGCRSADVCGASRQAGSKGKLTLETILLTAAWAKLPVLLDDHVRCQTPALRLTGEVENKTANKQAVKEWLPSQKYQPVDVLLVWLVRVLYTTKKEDKKGCIQNIANDPDTKITTTTRGKVRAIWSICSTAATSSCN